MASTSTSTSPPDPLFYTLDSCGPELARRYQCRSLSEMMWSAKQFHDRKFNNYPLTQVALLVYLDGVDMRQQVVVPYSTQTTISQQVDTLMARLSPVATWEVVRNKLCITSRPWALPAAAVTEVTPAPPPPEMSKLPGFDAIVDMCMAEKWSDPTNVFLNTAPEYAIVLYSNCNAAVNELLELPPEQRVAAAREFVCTRAIHVGPQLNTMQTLTDVVPNGTVYSFETLDNTKETTAERLPRGDKIVFDCGTEYATFVASARLIRYAHNSLVTYVIYNK